MSRWSVGVHVSMSAIRGRFCEFDLYEIQTVSEPKKRKMIGLQFPKTNKEIRVLDK